MKKRLDGKIALITGASRGIGAAVAKKYAEEGAELILVARTVGGLEETDDAVQRINGKPSTLVPLDLAKGDQIDALGAAIHQKFGRLDILVGNAAILGSLSPIAHAEPKMWQQVIDINLTANYRLLRSFDPLLKQSDAGRALFVTSGAAKAAFAYWGAYAVSKAGLEMLVRTYAAENARTPVRANIIDPGIVATAMRAQAFPGENPAALPTPDKIVNLFVDLVLTSFKENGRLYQI